MSNKHFRLCFSVINNVECLNGSTCQFAHSIEEFTPKICRFDKSCKNYKLCDVCKTNDNETEEYCSCENECSKYHPSHESKEDLLKRMHLYPKQLMK